MGKVVAYEKVTVPAGTFDCFRVEATMTHADGFESIAGRNTRGYCPAIKWFAKEHFEDVTTRKYMLGSRVSQTSELIRFRPAAAHRSPDKDGESGSDGATDGEDSGPGNDGRSRRAGDSRKR